MVMWMSSRSQFSGTPLASYSAAMVSSPPAIAAASSAETIPCAASISTWALDAARSCRHSALSKGIEAFISRMTEDGPAANRPPHIVLEPLLLSSRPFKACALALVLSVAGCSRESTEPAQPAASDTAAALDRSNRGSQMPDFVFTDPAGKRLDLASLKGKPVLLNLWATWCAPCLAEMPALDKLAGDKGDALRVVTVSQDLAQPDKVAAFFRDRKLTRLAPWLDPENKLSEHFRVGTLPTTIYYDAAGREVWRFTGPREWGDAETAGLLAEAD